MSTSLAEQLQRLAVPQTSVYNRDKKRPSLLFDQKEAAGFSKDIFYEIGLQGLEELRRVDDAFAKFEHSLFSDVSKDFERSVQDADANNRLDASIRKFLLLLSPYFLLSPAHKALEWLIYRYSIHEYNKDELLSLVLPYHETNVFVRVLQLIRIRNENDRWFWLKSLQRPGIHLPKLSLLNHAASDATFLRFVSDFVVAVTAEHKKKSVLTAVYNFYCVVVTGALERSKKVDETHVAQILPCLTKALSSDVADFCAAGFVITAKLVLKTCLSDKLLLRIVDKVTGCNVPDLRSESVVLLVLIYQSQKQFKKMSEESVKSLSMRSWVTRILQQLSDDRSDVWAFLSALLKQTFGMCLQEAEVSVRHFADHILDDIKLDAEWVPKLIRLLLKLFDPKRTYAAETTTWTTALFQKIERQYPENFDSEINKILCESDSPKAIKRQGSLRKLLADSMDLDTNFGVFQQLYHPNAKVQKKAVKKLACDFNSLNERQRMQIRNYFLDRLKDENVEVVSEILKFPAEMIRNVVNEDVLDEVLIAILNKCQRDKETWWTVAESALNLLCSENKRAVASRFFAVLPFLYPSFEDEMGAFRVALNSVFGRECEGFKPFTNLLKNCECFTAVKDVCSSTHPMPNSEYVKLLLSYVEEVKVGTLGCVQKSLILILFTRCLPHDCCMEMALVVLDVIIELSKDVEVLSTKDEEDVRKGILLSRTENKKLRRIAICLKSLCRRVGKLFENSGKADLSNGSTKNNFLTKLFTTFLEYKPAHKRHYLYNFSDCFKRLDDNKMELLLNYSAVVSENVTFEAQIRCLEYVSTLTEYQKLKLLDLNNLTVPFALIGLHSPHPQFREMSLRCLRTFQSWYKSEDGYANFVKDLLQHEEEILLDNEQTPLVVHRLLSSNKAVWKQLVMLASENSSPPYLIAGILQLLVHVNTVDVFNKTASLPIEYLRIESEWSDLKTIILRANVSRFNHTVSEHITLGTNAWKFINVSLNSQKIVYGHKTISPALLTLNQINRETFDGLPTDTKADLLNVIVKLATTADDPEILASTSRIFKHIDLDVGLILDHLRGMRDVRSPKLRESVRKRRVSVVPTVDILDLPEWKQGVTVLEFIQDKKKLKNIEQLLPILFEVLKKCLDFDEQASVEYPKQLVLSCILHCCNKIPADAFPDGVIDVELVVQCIRASQNPQTHHHALLVLAHLAPIVPTQVLHHIMAIFTFMGSSVLRHDDAYSFQIITKIIDTIVPLLVRREVDVGRVLRVFVDVLLDVPEHRRMTLYRRLLERVDPEENLCLFLLLVFEAHVMHRGQKLEVAPKRLDVAADLCREFTPAVVIQACVKLMQYLRKLPKSSEGATVSQEACVTFNVAQNTPKQFRHYKYTIVLFVSSLLSSKEFVSQVAAVTDENLDVLEGLYKDALVNVLAYIQSTVKVVEKHTNTPQAQYWKAMLHYSYDILDTLNALLTPQMFLLVLRGLVTHELSAVRRRVLELLNAKLQTEADFFKECAEGELFSLIAPVVEIVKTVDEAGQEQEVVVQTALLSLKLLVKQLAPDDPEKFTPILSFVTDLLKSGKCSENVQASLILCLAELCANLRAHAISGLHKYIPIVIKLLRSHKGGGEPSLLLLCTVTAVQKIVDSLALFLSPYLEKLLHELCLLGAKWGLETEDQKLAPVVGKLRAIREKLGVVVPARVLVPVIERTYEGLVEQGRFAGVGPLMGVLVECLKNLKGSDVQSCLSELTSFFLNALQFRCKYQTTEVEEVESSLIRALTALVLKLSENSFRPLFYRFYDWAVRTPSGESERVITFYNLSNVIAESLKGLFVFFAGHFLNNAASLLDSCNLTKNETLHFENASNNTLLVKNILQTLHCVFLYDSGTFVNRERFLVLMQPLVDQLENPLGDVDELVRRSTMILIPCVVQFAVAAGNDALWKQLVYQILLKMRHQDPKIRMIALECTKSLAKKLEQDYLPLLPETIPFLAELLEDEDEGVEGATKAAVQEMERVLGESLQKYF